MAVVSKLSLDGTLLESADDLKSVPRARRIGHRYLLEGLRRSVAFDHVAICGLDLDGFGIETGNSIDSDFPPLFVEKYLAEGYSAIDPLVLSANPAHGLVTDAEATTSFPMPRALGELLSVFGIENRVLIPIGRRERVFGGVVFSRSAVFNGTEQMCLRFISRPLYDAVVLPLMTKFAAAELQLTAGEIVCLRHAELGLTSDEIANECGYALQTVNAYLISAMRKLNANNRTHAIATALRRGLLG